jgi:rubrerythrin
MNTIDELLAAIEEHASREQGSIVAYHTMAADFADPILAQIMSLIAEDEERHHRVFRQMAILIRGNLAEWPAAATPPSQSGLSPRDRDAAIGLLRAATQEEQRGIRELRALARTHGDRYGGLLTLLFELMALDSQKHARMLRFVTRQLRAEKRASPNDASA